MNCRNVYDCFLKENVGGFGLGYVFFDVFVFLVMDGIEIFLVEGLKI